MCCCCDTDYNILGHLASSERYLFCCIFDESEGKCFAIVNRKNNNKYEKLMLLRKILNVIAFCKAQHNAYHMLKKSPNLSLHMIINVMLIKKRTCTSKSFVALPRLHTTAVESGRLE